MSRFHMDLHMNQILFSLITLYTELTSLEIKTIIKFLFLEWFLLEHRQPKKKGQQRRLKQMMRAISEYMQLEMRKAPKMYTLN